MKTILQMSSSESILYLLTFIISASLTLQQQCDRKSSCSCKTKNGEEINLLPLAAPGGQGPRYKDLPDVKAPGTSYSYNPCIPFTEPEGTVGGGCTNVAICQKVNDAYYPVGMQESDAFVYDPVLKRHSIVYKTNERIGTVHLKCTNDNPGTLEVLGELKKTEYEFNLISCYACFNSAQACNPSSSGHGLSYGSIILLIFFILLLIYIVGGVLFLHFVRHAEGKEKIPNYGFWSSLPGLIKEGFVFTFRGCKTKDTYQKI